MVASELPARDTRDPEAAAMPAAGDTEAAAVARAGEAAPAREPARAVAPAASAVIPAPRCHRRPLHRRAEDLR